MLEEDSAIQQVRTSLNIVSTKTMRVIIILSMFFIGTLHALNCFCPNGGKNCPKPKCPPGVRVVKDMCGCCDVCYKQMWQTCGGPFNALGKCDHTKKLICAEKPFCVSMMRKSKVNIMPGICIPTRHYKLLRKYCKYQSDLFCGNPFEEEY
uniref:CCN family member 1-like n=1 Tax=Styela clava TaxID=7725 RepID=UPI0019399271|nr:CCN family member 1-like [Styela clava]